MVGDGTGVGIMRVLLLRVIEYESGHTVPYSLFVKYGILFEVHS